MSQPEKRKGRPPGSRYTSIRSLKLRDVDSNRLQKLSEKLDRDQSAVIRHAIERLAQAEGLE
jgi:predicted transcriptional regulator